MSIIKTRDATEPTCSNWCRLGVRYPSSCDKCRKVLHCRTWWSRRCAPTANARTTPAWHSGNLFAFSLSLSFFLFCTSFFKFICEKMDRLMYGACVRMQHKKKCTRQTNTCKHKSAEWIISAHIHPPYMCMHIFTLDHISMILMGICAWIQHLSLQLHAHVFTWTSAKMQCCTVRRQPLLLVGSTTRWKRSCSSFHSPPDICLRWSQAKKKTYRFSGFTL